jgi:predicted HicB family RNase H-like nuclease
MATRRKPSRKLKDEQIRVRVTKEQKTRFSAAAERAGVSVSSWVVLMCLRGTQEK